MVESIVTAVVGGLIVVVVVGFWKYRKKPIEWVRRQVVEVARIDSRSEAKKLEVLREQVVEVARQTDNVVSTSSSGVNPTVVTLSDGTDRYYFTDYASYTRAMQARRVPPRRSFPTAAPTPVSRWSREQLEQWLDEHTDGDPTSAA